MIGSLYTLFGDIDAAITAFLTVVVAGIGAYIAPIVFIAMGVWLLSWSILMIFGKVQAPAGDFVIRILVVGFVLWLMQSENYISIIVEPAQALAGELIGAASPEGTAKNILQTLWSHVLSSCLAGWKQAGLLFAQGLVLSSLVIFVLAFLLSCVGAALITLSMLFIGYTKMGMGLALAFGPVALAFAIWPATRSYFNAWLNTILYFVVLGFLTAIFITFFLNIPTKFFERLVLNSEPGNNAVSQIINFFSNFTQTIEMTLSLGIILGIMFFLMLQLPTIASSMTHGSGGSGAGGLSSIFHMARSLTGKRPTHGAAAGATSGPPAVNPSNQGGGGAR
jgi:type IV secretion system protein VirB6